MKINYKVVVDIQAKGQGMLKEEDFDNLEAAQKYLKLLGAKVVKEHCKYNCECVFADDNRYFRLMNYDLDTQIKADIREEILQ